MPAPLLSYMTSQDLLVSIEGVNCFIPGDAARPLALRDICWQVKKGCHTAIFGPNGAGKSCLLRLLAGELWPTGGRILWRGAEGMEGSPLAGRALCALVSPATQEGWQRRGPQMTGLELMLASLGEAAFGASKELCKAQASEMAEHLGCASLLGERLASLSQGQLRLLILAAALARKPELLLLDECLDGLDAQSRSRFAGALAAYAERGTVILASHRPKQTPPWCLERAWIRNGRLLASEPESAPCAARAAPASPKQADFLSAGKGNGLNVEPLFELVKVNVFVERQKVLHDISWRWLKGEHWRISGPNGSGKSTFLRLLAGDEFAAAGGAFRRFLPSLGREAESLEEIRRGVRLVSDLSQALYGYALTGLELVCTGLDNSIGLYREFSAQEKAQARELLEFFFPEASGQGKAAQLASKSIRRMSTGELRRVFLARALMGGPDVLLLDEPCSGLDAESRERYLEALERLAASGSVPLMAFVSHEPEDAPGCCVREARFESGRLFVVS